MANRRRGRIVNRRHLARLERERIQRNIITIATIVVLVLVLALVGYALITKRVIQPRQPVALVGGAEISTREFQARVRYERNQLVNRWLSTQQTMLSFGEDVNAQGFFQNLLNQITFQLEPDTLGRNILNTLIDDRIIRQEAATREITVTKEELEEALQNLFGYYEGRQPPTPTDIPTLFPTSTLTSLQSSLLTTPTPTVTLTPTGVTTTKAETTPTAVITSTPKTTSTSNLDPDEPTPTSSPTAVLQPTSTPFTLEAFQGIFEDTVDSLFRRLRFTENDLRYLVESQLHRQKLLDAITGDLTREQEQVWARHIMVADEETALDVIDRLESGEDFGELATELSKDSGTQNNEGDLGWFGLGRMVSDFENVAFNLDIGSISDPVKTQFGWHIIQVLGHEIRPLNASEYENLREEEFNRWLDQARAKLNVEIFDYWADRIPTEPNIPNIPASQPRAATQQTP